MDARSSPRLEALLERCRQIWSERGDLRRLYGTPDSLGFWTWLMSEGWSADPALRAAFPMPPPELVHRVHGRDSEETFQRSALSDGGQLFQHLVAGGFDLRPGRRLLDFGCGCGRILRVFSRFGRELELWGADIEAEAIAWVREAFDWVRFEAIPTEPPTVLPAGHFDGVVAFSVFSHLSEERALAWLAELRRVTAPGAVLVLTVQGRNCVERFERGDVFGMRFPDPETMRRDRPLLEQRGFLYYPYPRFDGVPAEVTDPQGMTFVTEAWVRERWSEGFELVSFDPAPDGWQDYVTLRRLAD